LKSPEKNKYQMHQVHLLIGSNIQPQKNIPAALDMLKDFHPILSCSRIWKTTAYGSVGPDFLNIAIFAETPLNKEEYKQKVISPIETALKRERFADKNAPRTIDIDIILFDGVIQDKGIWDKFFITVPLSDLLPQLREPTSGKTLQTIAEDMIEKGLAYFYANCLES